MFDSVAPDCDSLAYVAIRDSAYMDPEYAEDVVNAQLRMLDSNKLAEPLESLMKIARLSRSREFLPTVGHELIDQQLFLLVEKKDWETVAVLADEIIQDISASPQLIAASICRKFLALLELNSVTRAIDLHLQHEEFMDERNCWEWQVCVARLFGYLGKFQLAHLEADKALKTTPASPPSAVYNNLLRSSLNSLPLPSSSGHLAEQLILWRANFPDLQPDFLHWACDAVQALHRRTGLRAQLAAEIGRVLENFPGERSGIFGRARRLLDLSRTRSGAEHVVVVDATEIGNEARFANHADIPNAALAQVNGQRSGGRAPSVEMLCIAERIPSGTEITIHYGSGYWTHLKLDQKPQTAGVGTRRTGEALPPSEWRGCLFCDEVLLAQGERDVTFMYERIYGEPVTDQQYAKLVRSGDRCVKVEVCPDNHPCYPGFRLMANKEFVKGERIAIYAGVLRIDPEKFDHLLPNAYTCHLQGDTVGAFGFRIHEISGSGVSYAKRQDLPVFAAAQNALADGRIGAQSAKLTGIESVGNLGKEASKKLLALMALPKTLGDVQRIFKDRPSTEFLKREIDALVHKWRVNTQ